MRSLACGVVLLGVVAGCAAEAADPAGSTESNTTATPAQIAQAQTVRAAIDKLDAELAVAPFAGVDRAALYAEIEAELLARPSTARTSSPAARIEPGKALVTTA